MVEVQAVQAVQVARAAPGEQSHGEWVAERPPTELPALCYLLAVQRPAEAQKVGAAPALWAFRAAVLFSWAEVVVEAVE